MTITKEEMDAAVAEAVEKAEAGLKAKNAELLAKLKAEKDSKADLESKAKEAEDAKEEAERQAALKNGDIEKITKQLEAKHRKELDALTEKSSLADKRLNQVLVDNGLTEALIKAKIAPQYIDAAKALIKTTSKIEVSDVDGSPTALVNGKAIEAAISEWSQGDSGKHFIAAPANGGGGSNGSNGTGKAGTANADMGGDKAARTAAIAQKFPNLSDK